MTVDLQRNIICRHYRDGQPLDVLGLNQFTLLVDRSETALTEVGWNYLKAGLVGAPHYHDAKEQFFFAVQGQGQVTISGQTHRVAPNSLLHIPIGAMHQSIADAGAGQGYLLINAFRDDDKEGKATFADHVAVSQHVRRQQADDAARGLAIDWNRVPAAGTLALVDITPPPAGTAGEIPLIWRSATHRLSASLLRLGAGQSLAVPSETPAVERTLFGLSGGCQLEAGGNTYSIETGTVVYLPPRVAFDASAGADGCLCLSVRTHLD